MHLQPEPESDLKGGKARQAGAGATKRRGTPERKRDPKGNSRGGPDTPEGAEDVVPPEVEDAVAAELLALGARCRVWIGKPGIAENAEPTGPMA
eukprot:scaffold106443_cov24-Tisochrysis_lutea.AAC.1